MKKVIISLLLSVAFLGACNRDGMVTAHVIHKGEKSAIDKVTRMQIKTEQQYKLIWEMNRGYFTKQLPKVDFSKDMVVAYFAGKKASGGYTLDLKQVRRSKSGLQIELYETDAELLLPGEDGITPFIMISIPQSDEPLHFVILPRLTTS